MSDEKDPHGKNPHEPGSKLDAGKPEVVKDVLAYFPNALREVGGVSAYGARKYTRMGWASVPDGVDRYTEALGRHLLAEAEGERIDQSGLWHDAQVAWNALARLELRLRAPTLPQEAPQTFYWIPDSREGQKGL